MPLLTGLIEPKTTAILKTLARQPKKLFHLNSLAATSKVPVSSTARIIKKLVQRGFAKEIKIGKWSVYQIVDSKNVEMVLTLI